MHFAVRNLLGNAAKNLFIWRIFLRLIGQFIGRTRCHAIGEEQPDTELFPQPAIDVCALLCQAQFCFLCVWQQHITVSAAAVQQIGAGKSAAVQNLINIVLHEKL